MTGTPTARRDDEPPRHGVTEKAYLLWVSVTLWCVTGAPGLWAQQPAAAVPVLPVQGSVSMLWSAESNVAVQAGRDGVLLVDTLPAAAAATVFAAVRSLSNDPAPLP